MDIALPLPLLAPLQLGAFGLSHRVVITAANAPVPSGVDRSPSPRLDRRLTARMSPGGLVLFAAAPIALTPSCAATPGIYNAVQVNHWREVTAAVASRGGIAVAQLSDATRSHGPAPELHEIDAALDAYCNAAENAGDAGFEGVELLASEGSLAECVLWSGRASCPEGGGMSGPDNLLVAATEALVGVWNANRVGVSLPLPAELPLKRDDAQALMALSDFGIAYLHFTMNRTGHPGEAATVLAALRATFAGGVVLSGDLDPATAAQLVASGAADAVGLRDR